MPLGLAQDSRVMINLQWEYLPCPPFLATAAFRGRMRSRRHRWGNRPGQAEQAVGGPELPGARAAIRFFYLIFGR